MSKYRWKQNSSLGSFPEVLKSKQCKRKRKKERNSNGQLCIANIASGGACNPPGPKSTEYELLKHCFLSNCL